MPDTKTKRTTFDQLLNPFFLTNTCIRIFWRVAAGIIALAIRIPTSIILAIVRRVQRARIVRW